MANFKGRKSAVCRTRHSPRMWNEPRWWHVLFHRRPHRRQTTRCLIAIRQGADPDGIAWPIPNRPQLWYW